MYLLKLNKCPICGEKHVVERRYVSSNKFYVYGIKCKECGFEIRELSQSRSFAEYKAYALWNRLGADLDKSFIEYKCKFNKAEPIGGNENGINS